MNICTEKYFNLTQDEYSKIKKFIDNNIDTVESILTPVHEFFDYLKNVMIVIVIVHVIVIVKKNNRKCVCLTDKYIEFCTEDSIILKKNYKVIF